MKVTLATPRTMKFEDLAVGTWFFKPGSHALYFKSEIAHARFLHGNGLVSVVQGVPLDMDVTPVTIIEVFIS